MGEIRSRFESASTAGLLLVVIGSMALGLLWWGANYLTFGSNMARAHWGSPTDAGLVRSSAVVRSETPLPVRTQTIHVEAALSTIRVLGHEPIEPGDRVQVFFSSRDPNVARYMDVRRPQMPILLLLIGAAGVTSGLGLLTWVGRRAFTVYDTQRADDYDQNRVRFAGHHRHGA